MECCISAMSAWGGGAANLEELKAVAQGKAADEPATSPKPQRIPPRERRRAPLSVRLAVEVADQACRSAGIDPATTNSVFASGMGDMDLTDYMCKTLAEPPRLLSPTRFHNSVHNAAAGYWTISTGCHQATSALCAFEHTFPAALLEAAVQCLEEAAPVLLVLQDIASPEVFDTIKPVSGHFACALVLTPPGSGSGPTLHLEVEAGTLNTSQQWPQWGSQWDMPECSPLAMLYQTNPTARALPLLLADSSGPLALGYPVGSGSRLAVTLQP